MYSFLNNRLDPDELRVQLRNMSDQELLRFGTAAKFICYAEANCGRTPRRQFVIQVEEARAEWKRRMPDLPLNFSV